MTKTFQEGKSPLGITKPDPLGQDFYSSVVIPHEEIISSFFKIEKEAAFGGHAFGLTQNPTLTYDRGIEKGFFLRK